MTVFLRSFAAFFVILPLVASSMVLAMEEKKGSVDDERAARGRLLVPRLLNNEMAARQRPPYVLIPSAESIINRMARVLQRDGHIKLTDFFTHSEYDSDGYNAFLYWFGEAVKRSDIGSLVIRRDFIDFSNRNHIFAEVLGTVSNLHTLELVDEVSPWGGGHFHHDYARWFREGSGDGGRRAMEDHERHFGGLWLREFINALGQNPNLRRFRVVGVPCEAHLKDLLTNFRGQLPFTLDLREKFHTRREKNEPPVWYWEAYDAMIARMLNEESPLFKRFGNKVELYRVCNERGDLEQVIYRPSQPPQRERKQRVQRCVFPAVSEVDALSATHHTLFDIKNLIERMGGRVVVTTRKKKKVLKIDVTLQGQSQTFYQQGDKRMRKKQLKDFIRAVQ